jgi:hypothetical protein
MAAAAAAAAAAELTLTLRLRDVDACMPWYQVAFGMPDPCHLTCVPSSLLVL